MGKRSCCGCFGGGCLMVLAILLVGGYLSFHYFHEKGVEYAASGLTHTVEKITEMAFDASDRDEINLAAAEIAEKIRSGEIGLLDIASEAGHTLEGNLHNQAMLLAFYRQNYESGDQPEAEAGEPSELVDRLLQGLLDKKVSQEQAASLTAILIERHSETIESKNGSITTVTRQFKSVLSEEDRQASLEVMRQICEENNLPLPEAGFKRVEAVKQELLNFFASLKKMVKQQ